MAKPLISLVPGAGLEPAREVLPRDFKSELLSNKLLKF